MSCAPKKIFLRAFFLPITIGMLGVFCLPLLAQAQSFRVYPAKHEITLERGNRLIRNVYVTNDLGRDATFRLTVEDVSGTKDTAAAIAYYGSGLGPYSIKNYLFLDNETVTIKAGQTLPIPVLVSLPPEGSGQGFYGGVFVSEIAPATAGPARVSTRLGALFFLRVATVATEDGHLKSFSLATSRLPAIFNRQPANFIITFENRGNIYLSPYGVMEIRNRKNQLVMSEVIEPWYVFPDAVRSRIITWPDHPRWGRYTANLLLNHGEAHPDVSRAQIIFWIIPLWWILSLLGLAGLSVILYRLVLKLRA